MERIVIAGGGLAGHRAAVALRDTGFAGTVVLVSDEAHPPYDRPPLSKQVLAGEQEATALSYSDLDTLEVRFRGGVAITGLDPWDRELLLADGTAVSYDGLVIATGRRARVPDGIRLGPRVHVLRSKDHAAELRRALDGAQRVVIAGGGFIGCEVAGTLRGLGVEQVTIVEPAPSLMAPLGPEVGRRALALHQDHGVEVHLTTGIADVVEDRDGPVRVALIDGRTLEADVVLIAAGSQPNTEWLRESGAQLDRGAVVCDETCHVVGLEDVVAAGDVAAFPHPAAGGTLVCIEHWAIARDMGALAARNLLAPPADRAAFVTVPTFWSDQHGVKMKSAGLLSQADGWRVVEDDPGRPALVVEALRGDEPIGVVAWNRNRTVLDRQRDLRERLMTV